MRLIDADELKNAIIHQLCIRSENYLLESERGIYNLIEKQQTVEQPKIIRCKDCKYGVKHELDLSNMYECGYPFTIVQEGHFGDFFCAMAEPKDGEKK